jgi:hypothetical protein
MITPTNLLMKKPPKLTNHLMKVYFHLFFNLFYESLFLLKHSSIHTAMMSKGFWLPKYQSKDLSFDDSAQSYQYVSFAAASLGLVTIYTPNMQ